MSPQGGARKPRVSHIGQVRQRHWRAGAVLTQRRRGSFPRKGHKASHPGRNGLRRGDQPRHDFGQPRDLGNRRPLLPPDGLRRQRLWAGAGGGSHHCAHLGLTGAAGGGWRLLCQAPGAFPSKLRHQGEKSGGEDHLPGLRGCSLPISGCPA